jgi:outer membrane protein assembly factor BamB
MPGKHQHDDGDEAGAPFVRGPLTRVSALILATMRRYDEAGWAVPPDSLGVGAFSADTLAPVWSLWRRPPLVAAAGDQIFAGGRAGALYCLGLDGKERWRVALHDDRSRAGRARGDAAAPFVADAVVAGDAVLTAAGNELVVLARSDGAVRSRRVVCRGEGAVVARVARVGARILTTCTARSAFDDERWTPPPLQPPPPPETERATPGEIVAWNLDLEEMWRARFELLAFGSQRPVAVDGGAAFACIGAPTAGDRVDLLRGRLVVASTETGAVRWARDVYGGVTQPEPVSVQGGVVAGVDPTLFAVADGKVGWKLDAGRLGIDARLAPVLAGERLLYAARGGVLVAVDLRSGATSAGPRFSTDSASVFLAPPLLDGGRIYVSYRDRSGPRLAASSPR